MTRVENLLPFRHKLRPIFWLIFQFYKILVLAKAVLVLALKDLKDLKNCGFKTKKVLRPFLDLKDLKILILDKAKFQILRS